MRVLLLLRGAPGVGKSTWIKNNGLKGYTISPDDLRMICQSPVMDTNGKECIGMDHEAFVWKTLFEVLEFRMQRGDFTVIDATNSKAIEMNRYKDLASKYKYRLYCVDMTDVPIEECKKRNMLRNPLRQVPEESIDKMYARFRTQKIPSGIKVIKPDELDKIMVHSIDLSSYKAVNHIGDIHGCNTSLQILMNNQLGGIKDDEFYIFVGDYLDRGIENADTLKYILSIKDKPNVLLLEGNHERSIYMYAHSETSFSKEFEFYTKKELDEAGFDLKELRIFYRNLGQMAYYTYHGNTYFVSHAGIATLPEESSYIRNLLFIPTIQFVKGVGKYNDFDKIAETWDKTTPKNCYQIYGHRNTKDSPIFISDRCFCLEGKVEYGRYLRYLRVEYNEENNKVIHNGLEIKNEVFNENLNKKAEVLYENKNISDLVMDFRRSKLVLEKQFGNISSFNFTRTAFENKEWNSMTSKARGLYINTDTMEIVARGYEKFFNINEMPETKLEKLQFNLQFPVTAYVKENGYLGLVSYNSETDDLFITTKSNPDGNYAAWLKEALTEKLGTEQLDRLKDYVRDNKCTFLFENVDQVRDPHIIKYPKNELYLLDVVFNDIKFSKLPYNELRKVAESLGLKCKKKVITMCTWNSFYTWYNEVIQPDYDFLYVGNKIEGFVIEDSNNYSVKLKLNYYNFWKFMRSISHETIRKGYTNKTSALTTDLSNDYYGWIKTLVENTPVEERCNIPTSIITLRDKFLEEFPQYK